MGSSARAAYIAARIDLGRTRSQAERDYKWAATRWDKPSAWHAARTDQQRFQERRVIDGKVSLDQAKQEAKQLKQGGLRPTERLASDKRIKQALQEARENQARKTRQRAEEQFFDKLRKRTRELEDEGQPVTADLFPLVVDTMQDYEDAFFDSDVDEEDIEEEEEWASSGGGSGGSGQKG